MNTFVYAKSARRQKSGIFSSSLSLSLNGDKYLCFWQIDKICLLLILRHIISNDVLLFCSMLHRIAFGDCHRIEMNFACIDEKHDFLSILLFTTSKATTNRKYTIFVTKKIFMFLFLSSCNSITPKAAAHSSQMDDC